MKKQSKNHKNTSIWLEKQILNTISKIDKEPESEELISILDKYISMKKKYNDAIDYLGETIRVMEEFTKFTISNHPQHNNTIKEIIKEFLLTRENYEN